MEKKTFLTGVAIENYKGIDRLSISFDESSPHVYLIDSEEKIGASSVLEACSLLFLGILISGQESIDLSSYEDLPSGFFESIVRTGAEWASITGGFKISENENPLTVHLIINRNGKISANGDTRSLIEVLGRVPSHGIEDLAGRFFLYIAGFIPEPLHLLPLLYYHSYRRMLEVNIDMGIISDTDKYLQKKRYHFNPMNTFKEIVFRSIISSKTEFENIINHNRTVNDMHILNRLIKKYCDGKISMNGSVGDSSLDIMISPENGNPAFSFDSLSGGQKEILSTLFSIWYFTSCENGIILIDEPELHLRKRWRKGYIEQLLDFSDKNQYIIRTHSTSIYNQCKVGKIIQI